MVKELSQEIRELWEEGIQLMKDSGAEIIEVSLPQTQFALPAYYILAPAEASSNLSRYDGLRYGAFSLKELLPGSLRNNSSFCNRSPSWRRNYRRDVFQEPVTGLWGGSPTTHTSGHIYFIPKVPCFSAFSPPKVTSFHNTHLSLIHIHTHAHRLYDSYYRKAQQVRRLVAQDFATVFKVSLWLLRTNSSTNKLKSSYYDLISK